MREKKTKYVYNLNNNTASVKRYIVGFNIDTTVKPLPTGHLLGLYKGSVDRGFWFNGLYL